MEKCKEHKREKWEGSDLRLSRSRFLLIWQSVDYDKSGSYDTIAKKNDTIRMRPDE